MKLLKNNLSITSIIPLIDSDTDFNFIRSYLLNRSTIPEQQIISNIAKTDDTNTEETLYASSIHAQLRKNSKWIHHLIIHYTHEQRLENSRKDIHQLWDQTFTDTPVKNTKLIVANRNSRNATRTLIHRRPQYKSIGPTTTNDSIQ